MSPTHQKLQIPTRTRIHDKRERAPTAAPGFLLEFNVLAGCTHGLRHETARGLKAPTVAHHKIDGALSLPQHKQKKNRRRRRLLFPS